MSVQDQAQKIREIKFDELRDGLKKGIVTLVDVRNPDELQSQGAIPGSVNIPLPEVPGAFKNLGDAEFKRKYGFEKTIPNLVFSCRSGKRAEQAVLSLQGIIPLSHIRLYKGSFLDWTEKGGPINK